MTELKIEEVKEVNDAEEGLVGLAPRFARTKLLRLNLLELLKSGPKPRRYFVKGLNMPRTTTYDNLVRLQKQGVVDKVSELELYPEDWVPERGRPKTLWVLAEDEDYKKYKERKDGA